MLRRIIDMFQLCRERIRFQSEDVIEKPILEKFPYSYACVNPTAHRSLLKPTNFIMYLLVVSFKKLPMNALVMRPTTQRLTPLSLNPSVAAMAEMAKVIKKIGDSKAAYC